MPFQATGYRFHEVAWGAEAGFQAVDYAEPEGWSTGRAAFGIAGQCDFDNNGEIHTPWAANTDMLLRRQFTLPPVARNLRVEGTVDNDATVYVNGAQIGFVSSGDCQAGEIHFAAPDSSLVTGGDNLLAVRGHDFGVTTFLDQTVIYDVPVYSVCLLYDPAKSHKLGSTVPLKIQLCDENGANVSSPDIVVHATGLTQTDNSASPAVEDSGNANPGDDFRYDEALAGYIFNKSTKGLSAGTWKLTFEVDGDHDAAYELSFDVR